VLIPEHIAELRKQGELLAAAAEGADPDAAIPTTPEWRMRDLLRHMGDVHRWARGHVAEGRMLPIGPDDLPAVAGPLPDDAHLLEWFREGHALLVHALETADPDLQCWSFLPAPSPLAFWARRQAHETGIHRADAESPSGRITPFAADTAVDGIEELLFGFFGRPNDEPDPRPRTLHVHATDLEGEWLIDIGAKGLEPRRGHEPADTTVRGSASDLFLLLWNRRSSEGLDVAGDASLLTVWKENAQIEWSRAR
jgi:uncharacterized protein (TIGR03083 family)